VTRSSRQGWGHPRPTRPLAVSGTTFTRKSSHRVKPSDACPANLEAVYVGGRPMRPGGRVDVGAFERGERPPVTKATGGRCVEHRTQAGVTHPSRLAAERRSTGTDETRGELRPPPTSRPLGSCSKWHSLNVTLTDILRGALARATADGLLGVKPRHLTESELNELLVYCLAFLWERKTDPSPINGWWYSAGGIRPWWERVAGLDDREALSLRPLRTAVYDLLEERGFIVKGPGNNVPIHVAPPDLRGGSAEVVEVISVTPAGAGFGDPVTNAQVERVAMDLVASTYVERGWTPQDVSTRKVGWDITMRRDNDELHVEVKGVSGSKPTVLLTRNEHLTAGTDPAWHLAVVTQALTSPTLTEYTAGDVLASSTPHVFRVLLAELLVQDPFAAE
jgi:hypothetical protein